MNRETLERRLVALWQDDYTTPEADIETILAYVDTITARLERTERVVSAAREGAKLLGPFACATIQDAIELQAALDAYDAHESP